MICPPAVWFALAVSATGRADLPMRPATRGGGVLERLHHLFCCIGVEPAPSKPIETQINIFDGSDHG